MKSFKELLEAKQVGKLYHYTSIERLKIILETNSLISNSSRISTTRDKNFMKHGRIGIKGLQCRFEIDGNKLSNKYKIEPYNYFSDFYSNAEPYRHKKSQDEQEEVILTKEIKNFLSYVKQITIYDFDEPTQKFMDVLNETGIPFEFIDSITNKKLKLYIDNN